MAQVLIRKHRRTGYETAEGAGGGRTKVAGTKASRHSCRGREAIPHRAPQGNAAHSSYVSAAAAGGALGGGPDPRRPGQPLTIVVDASVALKWLLPEPDSAVAERVASGDHPPDRADARDRRIMQRRLEALAKRRGGGRPCAAGRRPTAEVLRCAGGGRGSGAD